MKITLPVWENLIRCSVNSLKSVIISPLVASSAFILETKSVPDVLGREPRVAKFAFQLIVFIIVIAVRPELPREGKRSVERGGFPFE